MADFTVRTFGPGRIELNCDQHWRRLLSANAQGDPAVRWTINSELQFVRGALGIVVCSGLDLLQPGNEHELAGWLRQYFGSGDLDITVVHEARRTLLHIPPQPAETDQTVTQATG